MTTVGVERLGGAAKGVDMIEGGRAADAVGSDYVPFRSAGEVASGEYRCAACGYGVAVHGELPACPMCAATSWEPPRWSPFGRTGGESPSG